jgi:hypothetical protein
MLLNPILIREGKNRVGLVKDRFEMATVAKKTEPPRQGARKRVLIRGTLFTPTGAHVVWVRDVSTSGALVSGGDRLPANCDVIFKRGDVFVAAHIAWSNDTGAGINFYRDLSDEEVAAAATLAVPGANH